MLSNLTKNLQINFHLKEIQRIITRRDERVILVLKSILRKNISYYIMLKKFSVSGILQLYFLKVSLRSLTFGKITEYPQVAENSFIKLFMFLSAFHSLNLRIGITYF